MADRTGFNTEGRETARSGRGTFNEFTVVHESDNHIHFNPTVNPDSANPNSGQNFATSFTEAVQQAPGFRTARDTDFAAPDSELTFNRSLDDRDEARRQ